MSEQEEMKRTMNEMMLKIRDLETQNLRTRTLLLTLITTIKQNNSDNSDDAQEDIW